MANNSKYVVKVRISYIHMEFEFSSLMGAGSFMDMFIDHYMKGEDDIEVYMVRVEPVDTVEPVNTVEEEEAE